MKGKSLHTKPKKQWATVQTTRHIVLPKDFHTKKIQVNKKIKSTAGQLGSLRPSP